MNVRRKVLNSIFLVIMLASNLWGQGFNNLSKAMEPMGFRGITWGTNLKNRNDMILFSDYGVQDGRKLYKRSADKVVIGPVNISDLYYVSYKDRFFQVQFTLDSPQTDRQALKDILTEAYGTSIYHADIYIWGNNNIEIMLFPGGVFYTYLPILNAFRKKYETHK